MPLSKPVLATIGLWTAVAHWNHWFDAMLYIASDENQVLQTFLQRIVIENSIELIEQGLGRSEHHRVHARDDQGGDRGRYHPADAFGLSVRAEVLRARDHAGERQGVTDVTHENRGIRCFDSSIPYLGACA